MATLIDVGTRKFVLRDMFVEKVHLKQQQQNEQFRLHGGGGEVARALAPLLSRPASVRCFFE